MDLLPLTQNAPVHRALTEARAREIGQALETHFLAEMLKQAGTARPPDGWGGGTGEQQMTSFLNRARAETMVAAGGIGLGARIAEALLAGAQPDG